MLQVANGQELVLIFLFSLITGSSMTMPRISCIERERSRRLARKRVAPVSHLPAKSRPCQNDDDFRLHSQRDFNRLAFQRKILLSNPHVGCDRVPWFFACSREVKKVQHIMAKGGDAKRSSCSKDLVAAQGTQHTRQCLGDLSLVHQDYSCHHTIPFVEAQNE